MPTKVNYSGLIRASQRDRKKLKRKKLRKIVDGKIIQSKKKNEKKSNQNLAELRKLQEKLSD